ncbi:MAG: HNH endonuclease domain-containing protein [Aureispira sp.]
MTTFPNSSHLRIDQLSGVFKNTSNSYKFYWFWSLLERVQNEERIPFKALVIDMVALSWHTVAYYKLSLGGSDQLPEVIQRILAMGVLTEHSKREEVVCYLQACWTAKQPSETQKELISALKKLENYVPYRFISPFFSRLPKGNKERIIAERSQISFRVAEEAALYKINLKRSKKEEKSITIHPAWQAYLQQHHKILREFCWWNLSVYLRSRNPNVPNVGGKISPPYTHKRALGTAKKFWEKALAPTLPPLSCLYTNETLQPTWSIDHFVPWSFVLHDQLWNLSPIPSAINSSKNDRLPAVSYWEPFAHLQYQAVQRVFTYHKASSAKLLEDYTILYQTTSQQIAAFSQEQFVKGLLAGIQPLMQQANNLGFAEGWFWEV